MFQSQRGANYYLTLTNDILNSEGTILHALMCGAVPAALIATPLYQDQQLKHVPALQAVGTDAAYILAAAAICAGIGKLYKNHIRRQAILVQEAVLKTLEEAHGSSTRTRDAIYLRRQIRPLRDHLGFSGVVNVFTDVSEAASRLMQRMKPKPPNASPK